MPARQRFSACAPPFLPGAGGAQAVAQQQREQGSVQAGGGQGQGQKQAFHSGALCPARVGGIWAGCEGPVKRPGQGASLLLHRARRAWGFCQKG